MKWPEDPEDLYDDVQFEEWMEQVWQGQRIMLDIEDGKNNIKD